MPPEKGTPRSGNQEGTWRERANGNVTLSFMYEGERYSVTAPSRRDARRKRLELLDDIRSGKVKERARRDSLAGFLEAYLTRKHRRVAPPAYASYALAVEHLKEGFGDVLLTELADVELVQEAYNRLAERLAPATLRRAHLTLKQALRYAAEEGRSVPVIPRHVRPPRGETEPARAIPLPQLRAFLHAAEQDNPDWHALWTLAVYSGLRLGELLALWWEDVGDATVSVVRTLSDDDQGRPRIKPYPKTNAGIRTVPIPRGLLDDYRQRHAGRRRSPDWGDLVFANREGGPFLKSSAGHAFQRAWRLAKLPGRAHPHLLRHTYAKSLFDLKYSLPAIAARMGHADGSITLKLYAHFRRDEPTGDPEEHVRYFDLGEGGHLSERARAGRNGHRSGGTTAATTAGG